MGATELEANKEFENTSNVSDKRVSIRLAFPIYPLGIIHSNMIPQNHPMSGQIRRNT